jgi:hypothetical protein
MAAVRGDKPASGSCIGGGGPDVAPAVADGGSWLDDCRAPQLAQNASLPLACWPHFVQKGIL